MCNADAVDATECTLDAPAFEHTHISISCNNSHRTLHFERQGKPLTFPLTTQTEHAQ